MKPYSQKRIAQIQKEVFKILKKAQKVGLHLTRGEWGTTLLNCDYVYPKLEAKYRWATESGNVCAGGAILLLKQPKTTKSDTQALAIALDVDLEFVKGFIHGYDMGDASINTFIKGERPPRYVQGYNLGGLVGKKFFNVREPNET